MTTNYREVDSDKAGGSEVIYETRHLDEVFGLDSSGDTPAERARTSKRVFVCGEYQIAFDSPRATGSRLSAAEALLLYGWQTLLEVADEGAAVIGLPAQWKSGTVVAVRRAGGESQPGVIALASGASLWLDAPGQEGLAGGGTPVKRGADGVYRDQATGEPLEISAGSLSLDRDTRRDITRASLRQFEIALEQLARPRLDANSAALQLERAAAQAMVDDLRRQLTELDS